VFVFGEQFGIVPRSGSFFYSTHGKETFGHHVGISTPTTRSEEEQKQEVDGGLREYPC
jgi:hypothetical protein